MQTNGGLVNHSTHIRMQQIHGGLRCLRLVLVPGDQDTFLKSGDELHRRDPGTRGRAGGLLDWLADEAVPALTKAGMRASYQQVSSCTGLFVLSPL